MAHFNINKGVGKPVEFQGLQAQYIWYLFGGFIANFIFFAIIYLSGVPPILAVVIFLVCTGLTAAYVFRMGKKYGEHGLMLLRVRNSQPRHLVFRDPNVFKNLKTKRVTARFTARESADKP